VVRSITEDSLSQWFVDNYVRKCAEMCPDNRPMWCNDTTDKMSDNTVNAILRWRDYISDKTIARQVVSHFFGCMLPLSLSFKRRPFHYISYINDQVISPLMISFRQVDGIEFISNVVSYLPDMANLLPECSLKNYMIDILMAHLVAATCSSADEKRRLQCISIFSSEYRSVSPLRKAVRLMEMVANKRRTTREFAFIELSKAYLQRTLACKDGDQISSYFLTNIYMYLAVLHYTTGQYQKAIDHCTLVTRSQNHSQCSLYVVQGNFLPKTDDDIDSVLGLVVFYQYVRIFALDHHQHAEDVGVFTTNIFAHYFSTKHLFVGKCRFIIPKAQEEQSVEAAKLHLLNELQLFYNAIVSAPFLLVSDLMLCKLPNNRTAKAANDSVSSKIDKRQLVSLMTELSIQQLLTHRHLTPSQDTVSDISDFVALYLYRCQLYERCELLCQQTIRDLIDADINRIPLVSTTYREFVQPMDDDVASLVGLMALLHKPSVQSWFRELISVTHLTLSLYLLTKCQTRRMELNDDISGILSTLADTLDWTKVAQEMIPAGAFADHFMLKLAEKTAVLFITERPNDPNTNSAEEVPSIGLGYMFLLTPEVLDIMLHTLLEIPNGNATLKKYQSWPLASIPL